MTSSAVRIALRPAHWLSNTQLSEVEDKKKKKKKSCIVLGAP